MNSSLHIHFSLPSFTSPQVSVISRTLALKDFPVRMSGEVSLRVFYHKFCLVSCLSMLLRRTLATYAQADVKQVHFTGKSQLTGHTDQVLYPCSLIQEMCCVSWLTKLHCT